MKYLLLFLPLLLVGCVHVQPPPPNEVLIKQNKQCIDAGMEPVVQHDNGWDLNVIGITCWPKGK